MSEVENKRAEDSSEADESGSSFRVVDRRRFAPDGSEREDAPAEEATREAKASRAETPPTNPATPPASAAEASPPQDFVMSEPSAEGESPLAEPTLSTLLLSLSTQALMHLGEIPDLSTGAPQRDLGAARSIIDLIAVLQEKTRGNLDADEAALLERILYDLRMRFVEIVRS